MPSPALYMLQDTGFQRLFYGIFQDMAWLRSITSLPILIKGVLTAEDGTSAPLFPHFLSHLSRSNTRYESAVRVSGLQNILLLFTVSKEGCGSGLKWGRRIQSWGSPA